MMIIYNYIYITYIYSVDNEHQFIARIFHCKDHPTNTHFRKPVCSCKLGKLNFFPPNRTLLHTYNRHDHDHDDHDHGHHHHHHHHHHEGSKFATTPEQ